MLTRFFRLVGGVLRAVFRGILILRRPRPIHARGRVLAGHVTWIGGAVPSGIRWIDQPPEASVPVVARLSRSIGLPAAVPDVIGLAIRVEADGAAADIELASTGVGVPGRFLLMVHRSPSRARFGTLFPYRSSSGPVMICARSTSVEQLPSGGLTLDAALTTTAWRLRLYHATPTSKWHPFADLTLRLRGDQRDAHLRFDSVDRPLPGAQTYPWVRALRQPAYHLVQRRHRPEAAAR